MSKNRTPNELDRVILAMATEFSKIDNYEKVQQDEDLHRVHSYVAIGMSGIHDAVWMVVRDFIPAANKTVVRTRTLMQQSMFKDILNAINIDVNSTQQETIRLGYVFVFHKFEVFVNGLLEVMDSVDTEAKVPLLEYCKTKFNFDPNQWFKNEAVYLVNFISNCSKHQDGLCKLSNPKHRFPPEFENHPDNVKIIRTTQQFKTDTKALIDAIQPLIQVISNIYLFRTMDSMLPELIHDTTDPALKASLIVAKATQEAGIHVKIAQYVNHRI
jgi:hypothetical protein